MKKGVLILVDKLKAAGAENLAVNIAIKLKDSVAYAPIVCATRSGGETEERLKASDVQYYLLHREHPYQLYKFVSLHRILRKHDIQIIHAHKMGSNFWGSILGKIARTQVVIGHIHGQVRGWPNIVVERIASKLTHKLIAVSESERQRVIREEKVTPSKIVTIYNGINLKKFNIVNCNDIRSKLRLDSNTKVVGIAAELRVEKSHETFLLAAREVLKTRRDPKFLIIGDGQQRQKLEAFADSLGIRENCIFTGFIKDIPAILSILDVGVLSSTMEALPLALLEYMAAAKPIVATDVGGIPEIIQDGVNGYLFQPRDHLTLAGKITHLLDKKNVAVEMGRNGYAIATQKFSEEAMMAKIEDLYGETLAANSPR